MEIDMSQYKEDYVNESREHLEIMNKSLLDLEDDPHNMDLLNNVFRSAHTLKGSSSTMGYTNVAELTHKMENVLDIMRNGELEATSEILDILFECFDILDMLIGEIEEGIESDVDVTELIEKLKGLSGAGNQQYIKVQPKAEVQVKEVEEDVQQETSPASFSISDVEDEAIKSAHDNGLEVFKVHVELEKTCNLKSIRTVMVIKELRALSTIITTVPDIESLEKGRIYQGFDILISTSEDPAEIENKIVKMNEIEDAKVTPFTGDGTQDQSMVTEQPSGEVIKDNSMPEVNIEAKPPGNSKTGKVQTSATKNVQSIRVSIEKMDSLVNLVGELVINKIRLIDIEKAYGYKELDETVATIDRLTTDLRDEVMQMRMVPVGQVFNRFPRMVRDLSKKKGKEINFQMKGSEIELDRTVLDEIGEPLVHLLRNSVDHGVESPEERRIAGKDEKGTIELIARREKDHVIIQINDDGNGIDPEKLRNKAVEKGLLSRAEVDLLSDEDAQAIIFLPGLSTSSEITDTSGRGVGMDVVKTKIESLGGDVRLSSQMGVGTTVSLKLPLTMAIIQAMLVQVGGQTFAIPITNILEITYVADDKVQRIGNDRITTLRGNVLPLKSLNRIIGVAEEEKEECTVVVMDKGTKLMGLVVDSVIGQQEVVIKSLDKLLQNVKGFAGATILGDGRVILILDITTLF
ncbi:MAG: chemotaxis protein CheA [Halobacteriota archaeon]|nr:chemotaxis protein CheA [Halobacteriota archaeon]